MSQYVAGDKVILTNTLLPEGEEGTVQDVDATGVYRVSVPSLGLVVASEDEVTAVDAAPVDALVDPAPYSPTVITVDPPATPV